MWKPVPDRFLRHSTKARATSYGSFPHSRCSAGFYTSRIPQRHRLSLSERAARRLYCRKTSSLRDNNR